MSEARPPFFARVVPDPGVQSKLESGWYDTHRTSWYNPSLSWWHNGALVVDDQGPGLVDADGIRHALPLPPWGAKLVRASEGTMVSGQMVVVPFVFVADENDHPLFSLPDDGFTEEALRGFAEAAGLVFVVPDTTDSSELKRRYPGFDSNRHRYYDLRRSRADQERGLGSRVRRLLGRKSPEA